MDSSSWISREVEAVDVEQHGSIHGIKNGDRGIVKKILRAKGMTFVTVDFYGKFPTEFFDWRLRLVEEEQKSKSLVCPRCSGSLVSKETYDPFTNEKYVVSKCTSCGWC